VTALGYLLYPYDVDLGTEVEDHDLVILRDTSLDSPKPSIRVPARSNRQGDNQEPTNHGNGIVDLPFDMIAASATKFERAMNPNVALFYKLSTCLPIQYNVVPSSIRSRLLAAHKADTDLSHHLANEIYRRMLVETFHLLGFRLERRNPPSVLVTHDIDSKKGLRRAHKIKDIDDDLGVQSVWFLPSDEYSINTDIAEDLADGTTIGSHDTRHDGRLIHIRKRAELVERLRRSRLKLEDLFGREIRSFRAPLAQFNKRIVTAIAEAGYQFDFSAPCWEPVYPATMNGFGVEFAHAFKIDRVTEVPYTIFQDHQVLNVLGMSTHEAVKFWAEQAGLIHSFDGDIVLVVHPDYAFSENLDDYRRAVRCLLEIQSLQST
jgi:peptidoglycan/xylan/chitin deacetylase (PgdA/CDA1 family)